MPRGSVDLMLTHMDWKPLCAVSGFFLALLLACSPEGGSANEPIVVAPCHVGGCSGELCSERADLVSPCEYRPEYACYKTARCEPQDAGGACGWTPTAALNTCLENARNP